LFFFSGADALSFPLRGAQEAPPATAARVRTTAPPFAGRVTDAATGEGLPGANVIFVDLKQGTATGPDGGLRFNSLPRGRFTVQVRSLGYNTVTQTVDTGNGQPFDVKLTVAATEIGRVVVTGVSQATELRRSLVPTSVVNCTRLNQTAGSNSLMPLLTRRRSPDYHRCGHQQAVVRGLGYNRVVTLNNGARQEGQQWGRRARLGNRRVQRGPGRDYQRAGVAALRLRCHGRRYQLCGARPRSGRVHYGLATANYQSNNAQQGYSFQNAGNLNGLNWLARGTRKVAGNYRNRYDGRVDNSGFNEWDANGYVGVNKNWGYSHLTFSTFNQALGLTEGDRDSLSGRFLREVVSDGEVIQRPVTNNELRGYRLAVPRQQVNHLRLGTDNNFILGENGARLTLQVSYQQNLRREFGNVLDPAETSLYFQLRTVDYSLRYFLPEQNGWNVTLGSNGLHQQTATWA
jgi:iron complex outermembrane receptor protein